jgi:hypothetical protein
VLGLSERKWEDKGEEQYRTELHIGFFSITLLRLQIKEMKYLSYSIALMARDGLVITFIAKVVSADERC